MWDRRPPQTTTKVPVPFVVVWGAVGIRKCQAWAATDRLRAKRSVDLRCCR